MEFIPGEDTPLEISVFRLPARLIISGIDITITKKERKENKYHIVEKIREGKDKRGKIVSTFVQFSEKEKKREREKENQIHKLENNEEIRAHLSLALVLTRVSKFRWLIAFLRVKTGGDERRLSSIRLRQRETSPQPYYDCS